MARIGGRACLLVTVRYVERGLNGLQSMLLS
jgi:hypothetical protein